tara:strand:- start:3807 stop:4499 length:693 start_codon:yes stop_codon:yes gene_type:complete
MSKKLNVAICISGSLRSWDKCYQNFMDRLYNCNKNDHNIQLFMCIPNKTVGKKEIIIDDVIYKTFYDDEHLILPNFAENFQNKKKDCESVGGFLAILYQLQNIYDVFTLVQDYENAHNIEFDIIVRVRNDVIFKKDVVINSYLQKINKNFLVIPQFHSYSGINDRFAIGNRQTMGKYMSMVKKFNDIDGKFFQSEQIVHKILKDQQIEIFKSSDILFNRVRRDGTVLKDC